MYQRFAEEAMPFQVSGGIRSEDRAGQLLAIGVDRVVDHHRFPETFPLSC